MKLDITKLDGYKPEMTAEEKLALIDAYEIPDPDYTGYIQKTTFDKTASELAEAKRQLKAKMTEDEQKEAERQAAAEALQTELETLRKEKTVSTLKAEYIALGYDPESASKVAQAKADGDTKTELDVMKSFLEAQKQSYIKQALENTPRPPAGGNQGITSEQLEKMSDAEYYKAINKKE